MYKCTYVHLYKKNGEIMRIVVDASIIIAALLNEQPKPAIIDATRGAELISPASLPYEVGNALSAMVRRSRLSDHEAFEAIRQFEKVVVRLVGIDLADSMRIAVENKIFAYDAYLFSCARKHNEPLMTLDKKMIEIAESNGIKVIKVG
jgi:predicted nucleic acid-binding protein